MRLEELKKLAESATTHYPMTKEEFDSETVIPCPTCETAGHLEEYSQYQSAGDLPAGYQVFGIGQSYVNLEKFIETFNPQTALRMIELLERAKKELELMCSYFETDRTVLLHRNDIVPDATKWLKDLEELG